MGCAGNMVITSARTYAQDRSVTLQAVSIGLDSNECLEEASIKNPSSLHAPDAVKETLWQETFLQVTKDEGASDRSVSSSVRVTASSHETSEEREPLPKSCSGKSLLPSKLPSPPTEGSQLGWPAWVGSASAELCGNGIHSVVTVCQTSRVDFKSLSLDVSSSALKVGLAGHDVLELSLPAVVDVNAHPAAKWSARTKTLRVRLALLSP